MEHEWMEVGAFVWQHFDEMSGVSFLPYDGGSYKQAPYEECTQDVYEELNVITPKTINWNLKEVDDNVEGTQMLACVAGVCEI
jgi:ribonucleoside-diphosphate reductase alpha chain